MNNYGDYDYGGGDQHQGYMPNTSPEKNDKKGLFRNKNTMLPITLKQLLEAKHEAPNDQHYKLDGKELVYGRIVGRILAIEDDAAQCRFTIFDGTTDQSIELSLYLTQTDPIVYGFRRAMLPNSLAEMTFQSRAGNGINQITVLDLRPISDPNAITHHMLEVINTHLFNTRGPLPRGGQHGNSNIHSPGGMGHVAYSALLAQNDPFSSTSLSSASFSNAGGNANEDIEYILDIYRDLSDRTESGVSVRDVSQVVVRDTTKRHLTIENIVQISNALLLDGRIYSTIDEEHFKTTA